MTPEARFDIFFGIPGGDVLWVCAVEGLANAKERMDQTAAEKPGRYFVCFVHSKEVLATTDTSAKSQDDRKRA